MDSEKFKQRTEPYPDELQVKWFLSELLAAIPKPRLEPKESSKEPGMAATEVTLELAKDLRTLPEGQQTE